MISKVIRFVSSMQFMTMLIASFAIVIGFATFIENDFGRSSAKALIYNTWWFELILILLCYNLINNIIRYKLLRFEKIPVLTFHIAFIVILLGAGITRYISFEGMMHIREGKSTNQFISDDTFLQIHINDKKHQLNYDKKLFLSAISNNRFSLKLDFKDDDIKVSYLDFLPNVKDSLFVNRHDGMPTLHIVVPGDNGMQSEYLSDRQKKMIKGELFTYNNYSKESINIREEGGNILCVSPYDVQAMSMNTQNIIEFDAFSEFILERRTLYSLNGVNFVLKDVFENAKLKKVSSSKIMKDGGQDALFLNFTVNGNSKEVELLGGKGYEGNKEFFALDSLNFKVSYGSKYYSVPFFIKLRDFQLDRYPGSMSPSSYAAEVTVIDNNQETPFRIFMNNVLQYKGYRFFQSSYDEDEKGTILSVNHDWWGTYISYLGYFLLMLGMILVLFSKNTRFHSISDKLKKLSKRALILFSVFFLNSSIYAKDVISIKHVNNFDRLVVQDQLGRLKPVNTLSSEFLRKIYGKTEYRGLFSSQVVLGMMYNPVKWSKDSLIKVSHNDLRSLLGSDNFKSKYIRLSFNDFFDEDNNYILLNLAQKAHAKQPAKRSEYEKDIIKVDERVNICFAIFNGGIFRFFPLEEDANNTWLSSAENHRFSGVDSLFVSNIMSMYFKSIDNAISNNDWAPADSIVDYISKFQNKYGANVMPADYKISLEIKYNEWKIFSKLFMFFFFTGLMLLILLLFGLFNSKKVFVLVNVFKWLIIVGFLVHSGGLIMRWIISGHAPWSNGYESMIYIAWATLLSGLIFSRRSLLTLAATAIVASLLLMVAHLNWLDPTITNLVPVLKSYWLMIHVAIIVASYGFFALGFLLAFMSLWLIIFINQIKENNKRKLKDVLSELTLINEKSLQIGLFMLTIGTFLGGVWANESWGRYWGWDPKETWALASILVYAFVLHMRFIPALKGKFIFNTASMFAIWTIIMTYFGVNYYLSGLHSYAAGDPMPIPSFIYYLLSLMVITTILAKMGKLRRMV